MLEDDGIVDAQASLIVLSRRATDIIIISNIYRKYICGSKSIKLV